MEDRLDDRKIKLARLAMFDWINSREFKSEATWNVFTRTLTCFRVYKELYDQSYLATVQPPETEKARQRFRDATETARELGWIRYLSTKKGRPETTGYSRRQIHRAEKALRWYDWNRSEATQRRLERIAGISSSHNGRKVVTLTEVFWRDLLVHVTAEKIEGKTRYELTKVLETNQKVSNAFYRYLQDNGWREARVRIDGKQVRYITQKEPVSQV